MWFYTDDVARAEPEEINLYAVLNLNRGASQAEINERYRALSLLFHPDKQQNPDTKEAAEEEYFKVQKAYQVLSDSFTRQVYDVLGLRGLALKWDEAFPLRSQERIEEELRNIKKNGYLDQRFDPETPLQVQLSATTDTSALFMPKGVVYLSRPLISLSDRLKSIWVVADDLRYTFSKRLNSQTALSFESRSFSAATGQGSMRYIGTVRHQFSPRFSGKASVDLKFPFASVLHGTYRDDYNTVNTKVAFAPASRHHYPSAMISYGRRLFRQGPQVGEISLHLEQIPTLALNYHSPTSVSQEIVEAIDRGVPSVSGLRHFAFDKRFGLTFSDILPKLTGEAGVTFLELSTRFKVGFDIGFTDTVLSAGVGWVNGDTEVSLDSIINQRAVVAKLEFTIWKQRVSIPFLLSTEYNPPLALCSLVLPSLVTVASYHFIIRPRRRAQRIAQIRAARRSLEEDTGATKKRRAVTDLLHDVAIKYTSLETAKGGLVIQEALYGVTDEGDGAQDLAVVVTIPMQALVRNSQLYIPGGNSKSNLQGFSDPAPFTAKSLRIRYLFRGRSHYAEIPDYLPVVLPLSEHSIGEC